MYKIQNLKSAPGKKNNDLIYQETRLDIDPAVHGRGRRRLITALLGGEQAKNAIYVLKYKV